MDARGIGVAVMLVLGSSAPAWGDDQEPEPRPQPSALRLSEADVLSGFTKEVRARRDLRERARALWRSHFAAQAATLTERFLNEADWRPVLADAAQLVDDYLEASLLPRERRWREGAGSVWVEELDPATGQRIRVLKPAPPRRTIFAPVDGEKKSTESKEPGGGSGDADGRQLRPRSSPLPQLRGLRP